MYVKPVRIASVSDLHVDFSENRRALVGLATHIHAGSPDLVVVAGDVSHVDDDIRRVLRTFKVVAPEVAYIPGNHDLWTVREDLAKDPEHDTWLRYREGLKVLTEAEGCHYLPAGPLELGRVGVAGTTGWYDASLLRPQLRGELDDEALGAKKLGNAMWADSKYTLFRDESGAVMSDAAVARQMELELEAQLEDLDHNPDIEDVVAVTHVLGFREALGPPKGMPWDYFDAFMGTTELGRVVRRGKKVRAAVYGHTHRPGRFEVDGIRVHGTPLGYPKERKNLPADALPARAVGWIDLPPTE